MKLSDLVAYKTLLDELSSRTAQREVELELGKITHLVSTQQIQLGNFQQQLESQYNEIHQSIDQFEHKVAELKQEIKFQIELEEKFWFQESYRLYDQEMRNDSADHILHRRPVLSEDVESTLRARVQNYVDWQHPGMIIRPGLEKFVEDMVGFDPLYLVDQEHDLLVPAFDRFPEEYQRRLRLYTVRETTDSEILDKIPNSQFGVCLVYNFFEFKPFEIIKTYLTEIYQKLKPGGTLIMTFNDCDRDKAVKLAEQRYACYTPGSLVKQYAITVGYNQIFSWNNNGPTTWLELRKPGILTSLRGGQTLAKIISSLKEEPVSPEPQQQTTIPQSAKQTVKEEPVELSKEEKSALRQQALDMKLGDPNLIKYGYTIEKIKLMIENSRKK